MGANLVGKVLMSWTHLSDRAFRVLVRMAHTALDRPSKDTPADHYFAGRELLAMSLRPGGGTEDSRYRVVARVIAELIEAGAIERTDGGRTGHNAVYRLTLGEINSVKRKPKKGGQISHPQGGQISHPKGGQFSPDRVANLATPRNQEEPLEELSEERSGSSETASHPPREDGAEKDPTGVVVEMFADRPPPRLGRLAEENLTGAAKRRRKAVADYRAQLASGETT